MNYFVFLALFIFIIDFYQVKLFLINLVSPSIKKAKLKDKKILEIIKKKAGFDLKFITVIHSGKMFGGMSGIPGFPKMYLSSQLLKNLNKQELEYVILHESAHFKYSHPLITGVSQITLIILGLYLSSSLTLLGNIILALFLSFIFIRIARLTEVVAENFAAKNMANPKAMITSVNKFEKNWINSRTSGLLKIISWNICYEEKRRIAKKYI